MNKKQHRYKVTELHDPNLMPHVKVGTILHDFWRGETYTYTLEQKGDLRPWCTVEYIGPATEDLPIHDGPPPTT